jgi:Helix-turn-helix domain
MPKRPRASQLFPTKVTVHAYSIESHRIPHRNAKLLASEPLVPEPLLNTDQTAAIMRVHPKTLRKYARKGVVRGFQLGMMWRFRASEIDGGISERIAS